MKNDGESAAEHEAQQRSPRMQKIVSEARAMLREAGWGSISMRRLAARLNVKAPSLYKHISGKEELLDLLLSESMANLGARLHEAIAQEPSSAALLAAYREAALADPHGYHLMSRTRFVNAIEPSQLDTWIRGAFIKVAGSEAKGLAMWAFAHGLVTAELVQDLPPEFSATGESTSPAVDEIWEAGAAAFARP